MVQNEIIEDIKIYAKRKTVILSIFLLTAVIGILKGCINIAYYILVSC